MWAVCPCAAFSLSSNTHAGVMTLISTAPRAAFNELFHSLVCWCCRSAACVLPVPGRVAAVHLRHSRSYAGQRQGVVVVDMAHTFLGREHGKVRKRGAAFVWCAFLEVGREKLLSFPASGGLLVRECSPDMWEISTPLAWAIPPLLFCHFLCKLKRFL